MLRITDFVRFVFSSMCIVQYYTFSRSRFRCCAFAALAARLRAPVHGSVAVCVCARNATGNYDNIHARKLLVFPPSRYVFSTFNSFNS